MKLKLDIKQIMNFTPLEIRDGFRGSVDVTFSDGVSITMNDAEIVVNRYFWELNKEFSNGYIHSDTCIRHYYTYGYYDNAVLNKVLSKQCKRIFNEKITTVGINKRFIRLIARMIITIVDKLHNELSYTSTQYVKFVDMKDLLDVQLNPKIIQSLLAVKQNVNEQTIKSSYDAIKEYMVENRTDTLPMLYLGKVVKPAQVDILFGPRGGVSNLVGVPYKDIVTNSLLMGLNKTSWYFQEAGTAAKAAMKALKAIQDSETSSRLIQLITSFLSSIEFTDCGSTDYDAILINPASEFRKGDLPGLVGKFHMDTDGQLKEIKETDTHLIGTVILKRHIGGCKLHNQHKTCLTCFGSLGLNIGAHVNIGHLATTNVTKFITANHLAQKHHVGSTFGNVVLELMKDVSRWFTSDSNGLRIKPIPEGEKVLLHLPVEDAEIIMNDVNLIVLVDDSRMSTITGINVERHDKDGIASKDYVNIENDGRYGYMTTDFILYAKKNFIMRGPNFIIDMNNWEGEDIFRIINREFDFATVNKEMDRAILNVRTKIAGNIYDSYSEFVRKLTMIINSKMLINASWIEAIAYALTKDVYSVGTMRNAKEYTIESSNILSMRSFAPASAHTGLVAKMMNPELFTMAPFDHGNDIIFRPDMMMEIMPTQKDLIGFND